MNKYIITIYFMYNFCLVINLLIVYGFSKLIEKFQKKLRGGDSIENTKGSLRL